MASSLLGSTAAFQEEPERTPNTFTSLLKGWADIQTRSAAVQMWAWWCYVSTGSLPLHKNSERRTHQARTSPLLLPGDLDTCARAKDASWQQTGPTIKGHVWVEVLEMQSLQTASGGSAMFDFLLRGRGCEPDIADGCILHVQLRCLKVPELWIWPIFCL